MHIEIIHVIIDILHIYYIYGIKILNIIILKNKKVCYFNLYLYLYMYIY